MRQITLTSLTLRNFKGLRDFVLEADGRSVSAYGDNATGKTTLFDAFVWTLFGKDSQNRTDFEIKGLDEAGKVAEHGLQHEVEAILMVDRRRRSFKRCLPRNGRVSGGKRRQNLVVIQQIIMWTVFQLSKDSTRPKSMGL